MTIMSLRAVLTVSIMAGCAAVITGCGANQDILSGTNVADGTLGTITGHTFGGQQPISGAHVYVFEVGNGGYNGASTSLTISSNSDSFGSYVTTGADGGFTIASSPACTSGRQAYLYANAGQPIAGTTYNDTSNIGLMAPLGTCNNGTAAPPSGTTNVNINEVSTVVTAYALAGFATDATHISYPGSSTLAATDVTNAMANALNLLHLSTGAANTTTPIGSGTVPVAKIYTLANILAACVNSNGPSSSACSTLFTTTGISGNTSPKPDTAAAAIALAHAPFVTSSSFFALGSSTYATFSPTLSSAPADWTLAVQYNALKTNPTSVDLYSSAVDSGGNLWVRGTNDTAATPMMSQNTVTTLAKYSPQGAQLFKTAISSGTAGGYNPYIHLGIDTADNVWSGTGSGMNIYNSSGTALTYSNGNCSIPGTLTSVTFTVNPASLGSIVGYAGEYNSSNFWVMKESTSSSTSFHCTQNVANQVGGTFNGYLAADSSGNVISTGYVSGNNEGYIYNQTSGNISNSPEGGDYIALDSSNDIWAYSNIGGNQYDTLNVYNESFGGSNFTPSGGGLIQSNYVSKRSGYEGVHFDGANALWVGVTPCPNNCGGAASPDIIVGLKTSGLNQTTAITPSTGLALPNSETGAHSLAPDGSGNLWVALSDGSLLQFIGLTTPVATPVLYNQNGKMP